MIEQKDNALVVCENAACSIRLACARYRADTDHASAVYVERWAPRDGACSGWMPMTRGEAYVSAARADERRGRD